MKRQQYCTEWMDGWLDDDEKLKLCEIFYFIKRRNAFVDGTISHSVETD